MRELRAFAGFARRLPGYLRGPAHPGEARPRVAVALASRETAFLDTVERVVYQNDNSPYVPLLRRAGIEQGDMVRLVREGGVEGALGRLYDEGVRISLEEFKGRRALERPGFSLALRPGDLDNPASGAAFPARTGGSRGRGARLLIDLAHLARDGYYHALFDEAHDPHRRPLALWRPVPPAYAGLYYVLSFAAIGRRVDRWFSQNRISPRPRDARELGALAAILLESRLARVSLPRPEHVPVWEAQRVARWLAEQAGRGTPARLNTTASCGVRVARAAREAGLDISGSLLVLGGEPLTDAKAEAVAAAGARAVCGYYMTEVGRIGITCGAPAALDDVHVVTDKLAVIQRERRVGDGSVTVGAFCLTTLLPDCPRMMLNVESGDYGVLDRRSCGCPIGETGLSLRLRGIRSYDKLASEGMSFLGSDLVTLVEEVLPARFGGSPIDYQLVEEEIGGIPRVSIVVSPRVGPVDDDAVVAVALQALARRRREHRLMAGLWHSAGTLRVVRREPYLTPSLKVLPLHVLTGRERTEA